MVGRAIDQRRDITCWHGLAKQIALTLGTAVGLEIGQLPGVFDALGGSRQAQAFCKAKDGADDDQTVRTLDYIGYKAPVDFDLVEMK